MKVAKSCTQCRAAKRKCIGGTAPNSACTMCTQKGKHCSLRVIVNSNRRIAPVTTASDPSTVVSDDVRDELIDLYLRSIHDKPHTLFHPASLKSRVADGSLPNAVLFSILSFAARLSTDRTVRDRAGSFFQTAKEALKKTIDEVTLDNIHATVLIGNICGAEGDSNAESLFFGQCVSVRVPYGGFVLTLSTGIAFRMALILRLPEASPEDDRLTREIKLRTYWSLYMIDQWSSAGLDIPRQITDTNHHPLPMSESEFWTLQPGEQVPDPSVSVHQPGLWGYMVILARIFGRIQELHRKLANSQLSDAEAEEYTRQLALEFEQFSHDLPSHVKFTRGSLERHAMMGSGATFVALHLGYHHYSTLLYFHYLDSTHTQVPNQALFAARCKFHAAAFSDLLSSSNDIPGCDAVYFIVAHMTVISSSALLHTLLFGEPNELPDTRKRLFSNFQVLLKLKQYWPDVSKMVRLIYASNIWPAG